MKTFREYLEERNLENKAKKDAWKKETNPRAMRVDPADRTEPWKKTQYTTWKKTERREAGSAPYRQGDPVESGKRVTKPVAFATPDRPNALYAFPRKNAAGRIQPALSVKEPGQSKGTIYSTKTGIKALARSKINVHSASAKSFDPIDKHMDYSDPDEIATSKEPKKTKTTPVKNPVGFVRSQFNIKKVGSNRQLKKIARKVMKASPEGSSITYQDGRKK